MVMPAEFRVWEVVGGADKGGVLVRKGKDMSAAKEEARLGTGALVKEIEFVEKRLHYKLLEGSGPKCGWVSVEISNKPLLVQSSREVSECSDEDQESTADEAPLPEKRDASARQAPAGVVADPPAQVAQSVCREDVSVRVLPVAAESQKARWTLEEVLDAADEAETATSNRKSKPAGRQVASWRAGADMFFRTRRDLVPTFGYPGSFDERPPYSKFDIRDQVCLRVGGFKHGQVVHDGDGNSFIAVGVKCMDGVPRLFFQPTSLGRRGAGSFPGVSAKELRAMLCPAAGGDAHRRLQAADPKDFDDVEDSDEEVVTLCRQCRLPLGSFAYVDKEGEGERHGECMARLMLQKMQEEEEARQAGEQAQKAQARKKHDIGWGAERIPENADHMQRLGYGQAPRNMCCLVLQEQEDEDAKVSISETLEPAGSVNLEYLSLALRCRIREGAEPAFSLDPTSTSNDPDQTMQQKRFEPAWLAGTSVGDVLFQSDYLLKELSMGEYDQPVIGMKSCFDFSEEEGHKTEWRAREWFVVRNAGVSLSEDNMLIPHVEMAVEAREQLNGADGIEDSAITRPTHPMVKYADAFTRNFELIAERRSAVFHLRELAKASVIAKFLVESNIQLKDTWLNLVEQPSPVRSLVIPQLWNDRCHSRVSVQDGKIVKAEEGVGSKKHSVYGGVEFGLDRFSISRPSLASGAMLARGAAAQMSRVLGVTSVRQLGPPLAGQPLRAGIEAQAHLQGVDLNLSGFDLSTATREKAEGPASSWGRHSEHASAPGGFWTGIAAKAEAAPFGELDGALLRAVFNPRLSDRRGDGDKFVPPDTAFRHVQKLRELVEEEAAVRQRRKEHFCSKGFVVGDAGPLFPSNWTSSFEITRGQVLQRVPGGADIRPEHYRPYTDALPLSARKYNSTTPIFDKTTEDGVRFRIYRCSGLELRTTQELEGKEVLGVAFAVSASMQASMDGTQPAIRESERLAKVTEYVEAVAVGSQPLARNSYVVAETAEGNFLVTEMLENGSVVLEANPEVLLDRNSRARVVRSADCSSAGVFVRDINACRERGLPSGSSRASVADRKHYAQVAYGCAKGEPDRIDSAFSTRTAQTCSELQEKLGLSKSQIATYLSNSSAKGRKGNAFGGVLRL